MIKFLLFSPKSFLLFFEIEPVPNSVLKVCVYVCMCVRVCVCLILLHDNNYLIDKSSN